MLLAGHYQNAYVTADIDTALTTMMDRFGASKLTMRRDATQMFVTPEGEGEGNLRLALLQVGALQCELIQPVSGNVKLFADRIIPGQLLTLHHMAMRTEDIDSIAREHQRHGRRIALRGQYRDRRFVYIDTQAVLGHYLEYVSAPDTFWEAIATA